MTAPLLISAFQFIPRSNSISDNAFISAVISKQLQLTMSPRLAMRSDPRLTDAAFAFLSRAETICFVNQTTMLVPKEKLVVAVATRCTHLMKLDLSYCTSLSKRAIDAIGNLAWLRELDLRSAGNCQEHGARLSPQAFAGIANLGQFGALQWLNLENAEGIRDESMKFVGEIRSLRYLSLKQQFSVTEAGLCHLAGMRHLAELNLSGCKGVDDAALETIEGLAVRNLNLFNCNQITDKGCFTLAKMPAIAVLNLRLVNKITDVGLGALAEMPCLEGFEFGPAKVTGGTVQTFLSRSACLHTAEFHSVAGLSSAAIQDLVPLGSNMKVTVHERHFDWGEF